MALLVGLLFLLPILLTAAFMFVVVPAGCVVAVILAVPRLRRSPAGWRIVKLYCGGLALFVIGCLPLAAIVAGDAYTDMATPHYHYTIDAPRELAGIVFPAHSEVQLSPYSPHHLMSGRLGAPTTIAGLRLIGSFGMEDDHTVADGTLAAPHQIDVLPCGPGPFFRNVISVACVLAHDIRMDGFLLKAGVSAEVKSSDSQQEGPWFKAALAEAAHVGRFDCGPGPFDMTSVGTRCVLAADQNIDGYVLRGGTPADLERYEGADVLFDGTLAQPLNVKGVVLPPGTVIERVPPGRAEALQHHVFVKYEGARFVTPADAKIAVRGGEIQGAVQLYFSREEIVAAHEVDMRAPGAFVLGHERSASARFDIASGKWDLHYP